MLRVLHLQPLNQPIVELLGFVFATLFLESVERRFGEPIGIEFDPNELNKRRKAGEPSEALMRYGA